MNEAEDVSDLWQKPAKEMSHLVDHLSSAKEKTRNSRPEDVEIRVCYVALLLGFLKKKHPPQEVLTQKRWVSSNVFLNMFFPGDVLERKKSFIYLRPLRCHFFPKSNKNRIGCFAAAEGPRPPNKNKTTNFCQGKICKERIQQQKMC